MKLQELILDMNPLAMTGDPETEITGVSYDSRRVAPGHCFVCIRGFLADGRKYARSAAASGASVIVFDELNDDLSLLTDQGVPTLQVADCREALGVISAAFYEYPAQSLLMVGVTGTNGKTSITHLVADLMEQLGHKTAVFGTIANRVADEIIPASVTTPESLELNQMLSLAREKSVTCCAMEVSSHAMALKRVAGIHFDYGIFTNLTKDHLDFHETMDAYYEAKAGFFELASKALIINTDDPYGKRLSVRYAGSQVPVITYGIDSSADLHATDLEMTPQGSRFNLNWKGSDVSVWMPIPGKIYVYNVLGSLAVLLMEQVPLETAADCVSSVKPLRGRLEPVPNDLGFTVLIDYAHTPDGLENAISSARIFTHGRLITVFGCGGNRDRTKRPQMGEISVRLSDYSWVTSDNPRKEDPNAIITEILSGMNGLVERYMVEPDRAAAITGALASARKGDTVLIAGKGHETYQIIGEIRTHFDDREVVLDWLAGAGK